VVTVFKLFKFMVSPPTARPGRPGTMTQARIGWAGSGFQAAPAGGPGVERPRLRQVG
jgi:hypothetical protein